MIERGVKFFWFLSTLILTAAYLMAWYRADISRAYPQINPVSLHFSTAIPATLFHFLTALGVLFYFIGTGVWIKDQAMSFVKTDRERAEKIFEVYKKANKLKGWAFPFVTFAIFFGIMTFVLGGARQVEAIPLWIHPAVGTCLVLISLTSFPFVYSAINRNIGFLDEASDLIDDVNK